MKTYVRVVFETKDIAPQRLPPFVYVASALNFSTLRYTALVSASTVEDALGSVLHCWPESCTVSAEVGAIAFKTEDLSFVGRVYGTYTYEDHYKRSLWDRLTNAFAWLWLGRGEVVKVLPPGYTTGQARSPSGN